MVADSKAVGRSNTANTAYGCFSPPADCMQLVLVISRSWSASTAELSCLSRISAKLPWHIDIDSVPVIIGRHGMAWAGDATIGSHKREGDGKSPAGLFELGPLFGTSAHAPSPDMDYLQLQNGMVCVDDPLSRYYNQIVDEATVDVDWRSSEKMMAMPQYELGIIIKHNDARIPYAGSATFIHLAPSGTTSTAGCTALLQNDLHTLTSWLNKSAYPTLLQLPRCATTAALTTLASSA